MGWGPTCCQNQIFFSSTCKCSLSPSSARIPIPSCHTGFILSTSGFKTDRNTKFKIITLNYQIGCFSINMLLWKPYSIEDILQILPSKIDKGLIITFFRKYNLYLYIYILFLFLSHDMSKIKSCLA